MSETESLIEMSKIVRVAEQTVDLLSREKQVLQESVNTLEQQLSKQATSMTVAATMYQESLGNLRFNINELEEQVSSQQDSLGLLKVGNVKLTELVDSLTESVSDLEARNMKLLSEKQYSPKLLKQSNAKKLTEIIDKLTAHVTDLEARNSELLSEKQELLTRFQQLEEKKQRDSKLYALKMSIMKDIKEQRLKR